MDVICTWPLMPKAIRSVATKECYLQFNPKKKLKEICVWFRLQDDPGSFIRYTLFDKSGTVRVGRYQDPRTQMGHLISNSEPGGTLNCFFPKHVLQQNKGVWSFTQLPLIRDSMNCVSQNISQNPTLLGPKIIF